MSIEERLNHIAARQREVEETAVAEKRLESERTRAECQIANAVTALATELVDMLGERLSHRLVAELIDKSRYRPPVSVQP